MIVAVRRLVLAALVLCAPTLAAAQQYTISPSPFLTVLNNSGAKVSAGCVWTYTAGTTTPATTYTTSTGVANTNPIIADSAGRFTAFLAPGSSYKFVYENIPCSASSHGSVLRTADNLSAMPSASGVVDVTGTAGESITAGQVVYLSAGDGGKTVGQWYKADSANVYSSTTNWVGIATVNIASAGTGTIRLAGSVTGLTVTAGTKYSVGTAGALTSSVPTNARLLGEADTATSLVLSGNPVIAPQSWLTGAPVSGAIPYFDSTSTAKPSALLGANAIVLGGGAGATPFSESGFTISQTGSHSINSSTQPRAGAFNNAAQTATTAVRLTVLFNSDDAQMTNVGSMHSTSSLTSRMTVPTGGDGLYAVTCIIPWAGSAVGQRQIGVSKNGTIQNPLVIIGTMAGAGALTMTTTMYLNAVATDYFECTAYQDTGGNLSAGTDGTTGRTQMYAVKLW